MHTWLSPLAYAFRSLRRRPVFALLSFVLLTLATAAVTAIFAIVNATLLRPLPFREPGQLMSINTTEPVTRDSVQNVVSGPLQLVRWRAETRVFSQIEGYTPVTLDLSGDGQPEA